MQPPDQSNKLWVSVLSIILAGVVTVFLVSRATRVRSGEATQSEDGQYASSFPIHVKGLANPTPTNYVYRVIGPRGTTVTITYVNQNGSSGSVTNAKLPWSIATTTTDGPGFPKGSGMPPYIDVHANTHGRNATVTCQAFGDGSLADQETNTAIGVYVTCGVPF